MPLLGINDYVIAVANGAQHFGRFIVMVDLLDIGAESEDCAVAFFGQNIHNNFGQG